MIEETAAGITDAVVKANFDYLKHGMKLGVRLLVELKCYLHTEISPFVNLIIVYAAILIRSSTRCFQAFTNLSKSG